MTVTRFHSHPRLRHTGDCIEGHQQRVATLCLSLSAAIGHQVYMGDLMRAAMHHDEAEKVLGDMPAPAKARFRVLAVAYANAELQVLNEMGLTWNLTRQEDAMLRLCDRLDAWQWATSHGETGAEWDDMRGELFKLAMLIGPDAVAWLTERLDVNTTRFR